MCETWAWRIDYDNDTGPNDEGFWETWTVSNGERSFECRSQEDAEWLLSLLTTTPHQ